MAKSKFYVVWNGRQVGVFSNWDSCKMQIEGFKGAQYKSFPDRATTVCMVIANRYAKEMNTEYKNSIETLIQKVLDRI